MKSTLAAAGAFVAVLSCGLLSLLILPLRDPSLAWARTTTAAVLLLAPAGLVILGLVVAMDWWRLQRRLVAPDKHGIWPVARPIVEQGITLELSAASTLGYHQAQIAAAAPHLATNRVTMPRIEEGTPAPAVAPKTEIISLLDSTPALPIAPSWATLRRTGFMPTRDKLLLGYGTDGPLYGPISDLLSTAIAGRPGQGKSTLLRFIIAQISMLGGRIAVLDPHGALADDLTGGDWDCYASSAAELTDAAAWLTTELDQRDSAYKAGQRAFTPLMVLCDEWPVIALKSKDAVEIAGRVVLEARKWGAYALISGQGLPSGTFGGSLVKDALSSRYCFKTTPAQARMIGLDKESARMVDQLQPGRAIFAGANDPQIVAIPMVEAADILDMTPLQGAAPAAHGGQSAPTLQGAPAFATERAMGCSEALHDRSAESIADRENSGENETPCRPALEISGDERALILSTFFSLQADLGTPPSRRRICKEVFGGQVGGQSYDKVKSVLDQAGL